MVRRRRSIGTRRNLAKTLDEKVTEIELTGKLVTPIDWHPFPGSPQELAYHCQAEETLYGGQAGGGKTSLSIGLALTGPHHRCLILRRESAQLSDIKIKLQELVDSYGGGPIVKLPDRTIEVGGCQLVGDWRKYKGREQALMVFDELSEFDETQYLSITAWNRSPRDPCRILATTNPPTDLSGQWVLRRWSAWLDEKHPDPAASGEIRYYYRDSEGNEKETKTPDPVDVDGTPTVPKSRTFIRASVSDNPLMMAAGYDKTLLALPEPLRSQLAFGSWTAGVEDDAYQVMATEHVKAAQARWIPEPPPGVPLACVAIDPARGGSNCSAIAFRYGEWLDVEKTEGANTKDGPELMSWAISVMVRRGINPREASLFIDVIGIGASAYDMFRRANYNIVGVNSSKPSTFRDRSRKLEMTNIRAELWWNARERLEPNDSARLMLPPGPGTEVLSDLTTPRWKLMLRGIQIEEKKEIVKRLGRSPDVGDALVMVIGRRLSPVWGDRG